LFFNENRTLKTIKGMIRIFENQRNMSRRPKGILDSKAGFLPAGLVLRNNTKMDFCQTAGKEGKDEAVS